VIVTNYARILVIFGFILAKKSDTIIYGAIGLAVILLVGSVYKVFFAKVDAS
jgi:hypothetical protein